MKLSIITPTYNRANLLKRLYNSLMNQTNKNFEWILVDDGSIDNTSKIVDRWVKDKKININYIKKDNGGKHTALNLGIKNAHGEMIFIVDSDDYLTNNSVEIINKYYFKYKNNKNLCGFSFLKCYSDGNIIGLKYPWNEFRSNYNKCRIQNNIYGDKAEVFFTSVLKKFPFPEIENEKFISEDIVWMEISKNYDTIYINKKIYVAEYQSDGLTSNDKKVKFFSPIGSALRGLTFLRSDLSLKYKIKGAIIYNCYKREIKSKCEILKLYNSKEKILVFLTNILGLMYNIKWKRMIK